MKYKLLLAFIFCWSYIGATHLNGGQISYESIGADKYRITLSLYRDCYCTNCAAFASTEYVTIFSQGSVYSQPGMPFPGTIQLPVTQSDSCLYTPDVCIERANYTTEVTLPNNSIYTVVYQRCCWGNVDNIAVEQGMTLQAVISPTNNLPGFVTEAPIYAIVNTPLSIDLHATDSDGDTVRYNLCNVLSGASVDCPDPSPNTLSGSCPSSPNPEPYDTVSYMGDFNPGNFTNNPSNSSNLSIDSITGILHGTPNTVGLFTIAVCVKDFRNGIALSETRRYFTLNISPCTATNTDLMDKEKEFTSIYPNPTNGIVNVQTVDKGFKLTLCDLRGRILNSFESESSFIKLDLSSYNKGMYLLKVQQQNEVVLKKLMIQ